MQKIIVIGAGIGGLATALALQQQGFEVNVFEKAGLLRESGSGFILSPNGIKAINKLNQNLLALVKEQGGDATRFSKPYVFYDYLGKIKFQHAFDHLVDEFNAPMIVIERSLFHKAIRSFLQPDTIHCGNPFLSYKQNGHVLEATFKNNLVVEGDIIIGADGLNSTLRKQVFGNKRPSYLGCTSIRGVSKVPPHPFLDDTPGFQTTGPGMQFYSMRMQDDYIYWTATPNAPEGEWPALPLPLVRERLLQAFAGWHAPIQELVADPDADSLIVTDIYDRPPLSHWSFANGTIMGDAAHPMAPFMGQGANMAIENAVCIAECLTNYKDVASALLAYEKKRMQRCYRMVKFSHMLGKMGHLENPIACWLRDIATRIMMKKNSSSGKWIFDYEP